MSSISIIAPGTFIRGDLFSDDMLIVEGGVEGNVVGNRTVIKNGGWIHGDLVCRALSIEMGGMMNGKIKVSQQPVQTFLAWNEGVNALSLPLPDISVAENPAAQTEETES